MLYFHGKIKIIPTKKVFVYQENDGLTFTLKTYANGLKNNKSMLNNIARFWKV